MHSHASYNPVCSRQRTGRHAGEVKGPFPHGDRFILIFKYDVTPKCGPMSGNRMQMHEAGLFTTENGKITKEEFFYHMGG